MTYKELEQLRNDMSGMSKAEVANYLVERYLTSPPYKGEPKEPAQQEHIEPEHEVSPTITGLHKPKSRQAQRFPGDTSGQSITYQGNFGGDVGAHIT